MGSKRAQYLTSQSHNDAKSDGLPIDRFSGLAELSWATPEAAPAANLRTLRVAACLTPDLPFDFQRITIMRSYIGARDPATYAIEH